MFGLSVGVVAFNGRDSLAPVNVTSVANEQGLGRIHIKPSPAWNYEHGSGMGSDGRL